jgi:hypothetical protein
VICLVLPAWYVASSTFQVSRFLVAEEFRRTARGRQMGDLEEEENETIAPDVSYKSISHFYFLKHYLQDHI